MKRRTAKKRAARYWRTQRIRWKRLRGSHDIELSQFEAELLARIEENERRYWNERNARLIPSEAVDLAQVKAALRARLEEFERQGRSPMPLGVTFTVREVRDV